jgi:hypothetical protein
MFDIEPGSTEEDIAKRKGLMQVPDENDVKALQGMTLYARRRWFFEHQPQE